MQFGGGFTFTDAALGEPQLHLGAAPVVHMTAAAGGAGGAVPLLFGCAMERRVRKSGVAATVANTTAAAAGAAVAGVGGSEEEEWEFVGLADPLLAAAVADVDERDAKRDEEVRQQLLQRYEEQRTQLHEPHAGGGGGGGFLLTSQPHESCPTCTGEGRLWWALSEISAEAAADFAARVGDGRRAKSYGNRASGADATVMSLADLAVLHTGDAALGVGTNSNPNATAFGGAANTHTPDMPVTAAAAVAQLALPPATIPRGKTSMADIRRAKRMAQRDAVAASLAADPALTMVMTDPVMTAAAAPAAADAGHTKQYDEGLALIDGAAVGVGGALSTTGPVSLSRSGAAKPRGHIVTSFSVDESVLTAPPPVRLNAYGQVYDAHADAAGMWFGRDAATDEAERAANAAREQSRALLAQLSGAATPAAAAASPSADKAAADAATPVPAPVALSYRADTMGAGFGFGDDPVAAAGDAWSQLGFDVAGPGVGAGALVAGGAAHGGDAVVAVATAAAASSGAGGGDGVAPQQRGGGDAGRYGIEPHGGTADGIVAFSRQSSGPLAAEAVFDERNGLFSTAGSAWTLPGQDAFGNRQFLGAGAVAAAGTTANAATAVAAAAGAGAAARDTSLSTDFTFSSNAVRGAAASYATPPPLPAGSAVAPAVAAATALTQPVQLAAGSAAVPQVPASSASSSTSVFPPRLYRTDALVSGSAAPTTTAVAAGGTEADGVLASLTRAAVEQVRQQQARDALAAAAASSFGDALDAPTSAAAFSFWGAAPASAPIGTAAAFDPAAAAKAERSEADVQANPATWMRQASEHEQRNARAIAAASHFGLMPVDAAPTSSEGISFVASAAVVDAINDKWRSEYTDHTADADEQPHPGYQPPTRAAAAASSRVPNSVTDGIDDTDESRKAAAAHARCDAAQLLLNPPLTPAPALAAKAKPTPGAAAVTPAIKVIKGLDDEENEDGASASNAGGGGGGESRATRVWSHRLAQVTTDLELRTERDERRRFRRLLTQHNTGLSQVCRALSTALGITDAAPAEVPDAPGGAVAAVSRGSGGARLHVDLLLIIVDFLLPRCPACNGDGTRQHHHQTNSLSRAERQRDAARDELSHVLFEAAVPTTLLPAPQLQRVGFGDIASSLQHAVRQELVRELRQWTLPHTVSHGTLMAFDAQTRAWRGASADDDGAGAASGGILPTLPLDPHPRVQSSAWWYGVQLHWPDATNTRTSLPGDRRERLSALEAVPNMADRRLEFPRRALVDAVDYSARDHAMYLPVPLKAANASDGKSLSTDDDGSAEQKGAREFKLSDAAQVSRRLAASMLVTGNLAYDARAAERVMTQYLDHAVPWWLDPSASSSAARSGGGDKQLREDASWALWVLLQTRERAMDWLRNNNSDSTKTPSKDAKEAAGSSDLTRAIRAVHAVGDTERPPPPRVRDDQTRLARWVDKRVNKVASRAAIERAQQQTKELNDASALSARDSNADDGAAAVERECDPFACAYDPYDASWRTTQAASTCVSATRLKLWMQKPYARDENDAPHLRYKFTAVHAHSLLQRLHAYAVRMPISVCSERDRTYALRVCGVAACYLFPELQVGSVTVSALHDWSDALAAAHAAGGIDAGRTLPNPERTAVAVTPAFLAQAVKVVTAAHGDVTGATASASAASSRRVLEDVRFVFWKRTTADFIDC